MSDTMSYDVVIVGAGPAGLATAIRLKQAEPALTVCILEKGAQVGAHIVSGAVFNPKALNELLPDWLNMQAPIQTEVKSDRFWYLSQKKAWRLPIPGSMHNHGHYIISLGALCQWLATQAQSLGVDLFAGFAADELLFDEHEQVCGVRTGDMGLDKQGQPTPRHQPGVSIMAKQTVLAEGCRGSLSQKAIQKFRLDRESSPQTYGLGLKEIWEIPSSQHQLGQVIHTIGWPLDHKTYGGGFIYFTENNQVSLGFVMGLDYTNPYLSPFEEMQRFKTHPKIRQILQGGQRISYGARALVEGGIQALPKLTFPGGLLVGDSAGFLNVAQIKGSHNAIKSGILAADSIVQSIKSEQAIEAQHYSAQVKSSWLWKDLYKIRNIRPGFRYGLVPGLALAAMDYYLLQGRAPWTWSHQTDHQALQEAKHFKPMDYPKPDGELTFDRLSSVHLTNTFHEENQPCHLLLQDKERAININDTIYAAPETRYCPAGVYEITNINNEKKLVINAQNCIHCKTCDIKDPTQNIQWTTPEGGGGPNYTGM